MTTPPSPTVPQDRAAWRAHLLFPAATLAPVPVLVAGCLLGGAWSLAALLFVTVFAGLMDLLSRRIDMEAEFPAGTALSVVLGVVHFPLLALSVWALAGGGLAGSGLAGGELAGEAGTGWLSRLASFAALGVWFGQVSNSNAHELIHRPGAGLARLGRWIYISLLFGHHASAHPKVHHRHVGSPADPNTARRGESFHRFARRAWLGSFRAGYRAEAELLARGATRRAHPYRSYLLGAVLCLGAAAGIGGVAGLAWYLALCAHAQIQLLLSDYVQHYGLQRAEIAPGRFEPVAARHSWNAPHPYSSRMMLHAPRHSDHHAHPARPFTALTLPDGAPTLPHSVPVMALLALYPRGWKRVMHPRLDALQSGPAG
ncbi:alkane 1-monooxygenase [Mesobaculum littorinae]|uniref:Alkane 1-monooxygenase n=1 Tax=Mesobaculum littorinae TaxID=2486419 RepID=A0A438AIZ4_9RHOB|nr:alkane 1-monooxygenase [Mesobaculum littorinae]RVV98741.1 alkane 1-monooxygenase [Mesobaculum littorinae]